MNKVDRKGLQEEAATAAGGVSGGKPQRQKQLANCQRHADGRERER